MIEGLLLLLVAFWVAVDTTAWGQLLVSEPIFTGILAGAILGEVWTGMSVGALFQVLWSSRAPLGGVLFPWAGPATLGAVVVTVWASSQTTLGFSAPELLPLTGALAAGMGGGEMGRRVLGWLRGRRDYRWAKLAADPGRNLKRVSRLHLQEVIGEGLLGVLVSTTSVALGLLTVLILRNLSQIQEGGVILFGSVVAFGLGLCFRAWVSQTWQKVVVVLGAMVVYLGVNL